MSVLIKGMEMPEACFWRDKNDSLIVCLLFDADGYCRADGKQRCLVPENEMPNDCPLIELPPHGRLIDADALEQEAQKRLLICNKYDDQFQKPYEVMRAIALAPIIIPAEEE